MASGAAVDEEDWVAAVVTGTSWRADGTVGGRLAGFSAGDKRRETSSATRVISASIICGDSRASGCHRCSGCSSLGGS